MSILKSIRVRKKGKWKTVKKIGDIQNCEAIEIKELLTLAELKKFYPQEFHRYI